MAIVSEKLNLCHAVGPAELYGSPVHRWFVFPHSFSASLVNSILDWLGAGPHSVVLDPCLGAATTLVVCRTRGISAIGTDIMPLSVVVGTAKVSEYQVENIQTATDLLRTKLGKLSPIETHTDVTLLQRAFPPLAVGRVSQIRDSIQCLLSVELRPFFLTALARCFSRFGAIRRDGGWPRLIDKAELEPELVDETFLASVNEMMADIKDEPGYFCKKRGSWTVSLGDMRSLQSEPLVDYIITSPPYLNKHDYTRIFTPELSLLGICSNAELIDLRYRTMRSHVEARQPPSTPQLPNIRELKAITNSLSSHSVDGQKVSCMVTGYFEDLLAFLTTCYAHLHDRGCVCLVISNVQFFGIQIPVDNITVHLGRKAGFELEEQWILRYRGNSSQQMAKFERMPSRESVLFLRKKV